MYDIDKITTWLKNNVFRNEHIAYDITDDFGISTYSDDKFAFNDDTPNIAYMRIFPVSLSFLVDPMNMKLRVSSEVELKMI